MRTGSTIRWMTWSLGTMRSRRRKSAMNSAARWRRRTIPYTMPVRTQKAARSAAVPLRTYSNSRRAGWSGAAGWLGAVGSRTPMPVFSSTAKSGPSVGGWRCNSMMSTALATKSGSRSFIQESKTVQAQLVRLDNGANRALLGGSHAQLGMLANVGRQIGDGPVGLAVPAQIGRFLTGQQDDLGLNLRAVEARRRVMRPIHQAVETLGGEAVASVLGGMGHDAQGGGNVFVLLARGGAQDNLRAQGALLAPRPGMDAAFKFGSLLRCEADRSRVTAHRSALLAVRLTGGKAYACWLLLSNIEWIDY